MADTQDCLLCGQDVATGCDCRQDGMVDDFEGAHTHLYEARTGMGGPGTMTCLDPLCVRPGGLAGRSSTC